MNKSIFLARVIGLYYIITGLFMLVAYRQIDTITSSFVSQPALIILVGALTLIIGLLLVVSHNLWVKDWRVLITIIAWLTLIMGIIRLFCYAYLPTFSEGIIAHKGYMFIPLIICFIVGIYLTCKGFSSSLRLRINDTK